MISVNTGSAVDVPWEGGVVTTAIHKEPVPGRVRVSFLGLEGDSQADRKVHGGPMKAVYAYPSEHYAYWAETLGRKLSWGAFGENLTTEGLSEETLSLGDLLRVGTAALGVTKPRTPCYKLGVRFGRRDMPKLFELSGRSGFYLRVAREGFVKAGDEIEVVRGSGSGPSIAEVFRSILQPKG